jgi:hypothetical protein
MWGALAEGGKQIVKKFGEMIDREGAQQQQPQTQ